MTAALDRRRADETDAEPWIRRDPPSRSMRGPLREAKFICAALFTTTTKATRRGFHHPPPRPIDEDAATRNPG